MGAGAPRWPVRLIRTISSKRSIGSLLRLGYDGHWDVSISAAVQQGGRNERFSHPGRAEKIETSGNLGVPVAHPDADRVERRVFSAGPKQAAARGRGAGEGDGDGNGPQAGNLPKRLLPDLGRDGRGVSGHER